MRITTFVIAAALLLAGSAAAQQTTPGQSQPPTPGPPAAVQPADTAGAQSEPAGEVEIGVRGTVFSSGSDRARFQRYQDRTTGPALMRLRWRRDNDHWGINVGADNAPYRDQHYFAAFDRYGKIRASFEWQQIPLFYSEDTSWIYYSPGPSELRIPDPSIQQRIQAGTLRIQDLRTLGVLQQFDLRQRRDQAAFSLRATPWKDVDASFTVNNSRKSGRQPWAESFGFNAANEVAAPLSHNTTDLNAVLEWANDRGMARVAWDGSWFNNGVESLIADSPWRATDSTNPSAYVAGNGTARGRMSLWPDSTANTISAGAAYNLPRRSRLNGMASVGNWDQNGTLLPYTINTAIPQIPLDRLTAEAKARVTAFNVNFVSRPTNLLWFNVRARRYDFNNRTPIFRVSEYVRLDQVVEPSVLGRDEPFGYTRDSVDADASFTFLPYTALRVGYSRESDERTYRVIEQTDQDTFRASIDTVGNQYVTFRLGYERAQRRGSGIDEVALDEIGEQASLRQFDISDLDRDAVTAQVQVTPLDRLSFNASLVTARDNRPDANFGLLKFDNTMYGVGADLTLGRGASAGISFGHENSKSNQKSRQANPGPQFTDPTRDWFTRMNDRVRYVVADLDVPKVWMSSDVRVALEWNRSDTDYRYELPSNSTLTVPSQLPTVYNELWRARVSLKRSFTRHIGGSAMYMYDAYHVDDFALSPQYAYGQRTLPDGLMLGYFWRPYTANTFSAGVTYVW